MVSNVLGMTAEKLADRLTEIARSHPADPEYKRLRRQLPADWPF